MRTAAIGIGLALVLGGCGGSSGGTTSTGAGTVTAPTTTRAGVPQPGPVAPAATTGQVIGSPAATEASPGQPPHGPTASGELSTADRSSVAATVSSYIRALDHHDAAGVCALIATCHGSLPGTIGTKPANGGPAWRRSTLSSVRVERLSDDRARVSATVVHHFSDRRYVSIEDDVIYLERSGGLWLLAKPSGTLYRAIGFPQPPLSALRPPSGW